MKRLIRAVAAILLCGSMTMLWGCGLSDVIYENADKYSVGNGEFEGVDNIDIGWSSGKVSVEYYDGDSVKIEESYDGEITDEAKVHWLLEDGTLTVHYAKSGYSVSRLTGITEKKLTVSLPRKFEFNSLEIAVTSAEVVTEPLTGDSLIISSSSGEIGFNCDDVKEAEISSSSGKINAVINSVGVADIESSSGDIDGIVAVAGELDISSASGKVTVNGDSVEKGDIETTSGSIDFSVDGGIGECDISSTSGKVNLLLPEDMGFTLEYETGSGDFNSDFALTKTGDEYVYRDGKAEIEIETSSGDIAVNCVKMQSVQG